jgi:hypothetical protein
VDVINSEHRKMRAKQQHVCKEMNHYMINTNRKWILSFGIEWTIGEKYRNFIILDYFSLFFNSTYSFNSIAKEIFWAEIYRGRLFCRAEIYRGRHFFRADRSLGAKQEGLTIVHFLNKLIVSCKEAVRFPF